MAKNAARRPKDGDWHFDDFTAKDFDWLDGRVQPTASVAEPQDLPRGDASRSLRQLEAALLPAVSIARDLFRAIASGQSHPSVDLTIVSIFTDYRHYLGELKASVLESGDAPDEVIKEYITCIGHVLGCFDKLLRGEGITRVDALKADAWLRDVPGETLLFNRTI